MCGGRPIPSNQGNYDTLTQFNYITHWNCGIGGARGVTPLPILPEEKPT